MSRTVNLVLRLDSEGIAKGSARLGELRAAGKAAEQQTDKLADSSERASARTAAAAEKAAARTAAAAEKAAARAADVAEKAAAREAAAAERAATRAAAAAARAAARDNERWNEAIQKAKARHDREAEAAERSAQRQAAAAERAAKRQEEAWNNAIQRAKARAEREGWGKDGILPIRPSLQRIEGKLNENQGGGIGAALGGAKAAAVTAAVAGVAIGAHEMIALAREADVLQASLGTVTGSAEKGKAAFEGLLDINAETIFGIKNMSEAYIRLANLGIRPTTETMKAYSNIASGTRKDITDVADAVASASMGTFKGLKQLGITAVEVDGKLQMTFRGTKTTIENTGRAIEKYVAGIGMEHFAGAVENRMKTLDGALLAHANAWEDLGRSIATSGVDTALAKVINLATKGVEKLGQMGATFAKALPVAFGSKSYYSIDELTKMSAAAPNDDAIKTLLELQKDKAKWPRVPQAQSEALVTQINWNEYMRSQAASKAAGPKGDPLAETKEEAAAALKARNDSEIAAIRRAARTKRQVVDEEYVKDIEQIKKITEGDIRTRNELMAKRYAKYQEDTKKTGGDGSAKAEAERRRYLEALGKSDPLLKLSLDYDERQKAINKNTKAESSARAEQTAANKAKYDEDVAAFVKAQTEKLDSVINSLKGEDFAIKQQFESQMAIVEQEVKRESDKAKLIAELKIKYNQQVSASREAGIREREGLIGDLASPQAQMQAQWDARLRAVRGARVGGPGAPFAFDDEKLDAESQVRLRAIREQARMKREMDMQRREMLTPENDELGRLRNEEQRKLEILRRAHEEALLDETEYQRAKAQVKKDAATKERELTMQQAQLSLQSGEALFGDLATAMRNWNGEQSNSYRAMFALQKSFAIAQGMLAAAQAVAKGLELGIPAGIPSMLAGAAAGANVVAQISSINYAGGRARGGTVGANEFALMGEEGPEFVRGPATVISTRETARILNSRGTGGGGDYGTPTGQRPVQVSVINVGDMQAALRQAMTTTAGKQVLVNVIRENPQLVRSIR